MSSLCLSANFDGLTFGDLRKLVEVSKDWPDDTEVCIEYNPNSLEPCAITVPISAAEVTPS